MDSNSNIISELLYNFKKEKNALLILGAGNQTDTAFSPKTLSILDKSGKSAIIVRNHRFSEVHARSFTNFIIPKIIQIKFILNLVKLNIISSNFIIIFLRIIYLFKVIIISV